MTGLIITGTDTDIGKTVVASMLTLALNGCYFKPIQCGIEPETDVDTVKRLTGLGDDRVLPTPIVLSQPRSPHLAAELDNVTIDVDQLAPPSGSLIVEGAGGLMVPIDRHTLYIDVFARWQKPVVLVAKSELGTLNHTLLSLEALAARNIKVLGVVLVGDDNPDNAKTIAEMGHANILGRVPKLPQINPVVLLKVFADHFKPSDFGGFS